jgi:UPF0716 protein FxsA
MGRLLLGLALLPLLEIAIFIAAGRALGLWPVLGLVIAAALLGAILLRTEGLRTLSRVEAAIGRREMPVRPLFDGACRVASGLLLIVPGFLTDAIGLMLLLPPVRALLARAIGRAIGARVRRGAGAAVVEGDFRIVDEEQPRLPP